MGAGACWACETMGDMRSILLSVSVAFSIACSSSVDPGGAAAGTGGAGEGGGSTTTTGSGGPSCSELPGDGPCAPLDPACTAVASDCLALADPCGATAATLRVADLALAKPAVFAQGFVSGILRDGVTLDMPACYLEGGGVFSWLLQFDSAAGTLRTGGAKPAPVGQPYCFTDETVDVGGVPQLFAPVTVPAAVAADGSFDAGGFDLRLPIYLDVDAANVLPLPLRATRIEGTLSPARRCIGSFDDDGLSPANFCLPDPDKGQWSFEHGATVHALISLEDADQAVVVTLDQSLCVLLSGDPTTYGDGGSPQRCKRDGNGTIVLAGDWCAATDAPASPSCADALELSGTLAASAVPLGDGC